MRQRAIVAALCAALLVIGTSADLRAAGTAKRSPTTAHAYLRTTLGGYAVTVTATTGRKTAELVVHMSRGNPAVDEQTHSYAFDLAPGAVTIDPRLGKARIKARLGSFGAVNLSLAGRGKTSLQRSSSPCSGPATLSRSARARGSINIKLGSLGTLHSAGQSSSLDRLQKRGTVHCRAAPCRRYAGAAIAGINSGDNYLSIQSDGLGHTFVFGTVEQRVKSPSIAISHTRLANGGSLVASQAGGPDDLLITLNGTGPATGKLTFAGTGGREPDTGCKGHSVRRIFGPANGQLELPIDGVGVVRVAADGSATAPAAAYREQVN